MVNIGLFLHKGWKLFTEADKKQLEPAVYLSLPGDVKDTIQVIDNTDIINDALDTIIAELDKLYIKDETTQAFCALIKEFVEYRQPNGTNLPKLLVNFNQKYQKLKEHKLVLTNGVLVVPTNCVLLFVIG